MVAPAQQLQDPALFDASGLDAALAHTGHYLGLFRAQLEHATKTLKERFVEGTPAAELVPLRAWVVDQLLIRAWQRLDHGGDDDDLALIAVGGYGRGELHPHSDIDLLILLRHSASPAFRDAIAAFLRCLWDIGLEVGHSVRSLHECVHESARDVTVATNMMEARLLAGSQELYARLQATCISDEIWSRRRFFAAKLQEQEARYRKYNDTAYNLEPNIKSSPGGLRDIHMIGWVAKRHFGTATLHGLVDHGFLTEAEYETLREGQDFLWQIRYGLHVLTGRREDRLLFDYQRTLAQQLGFRDEGAQLGVERFMKRYYRTVMELDRLNEMLLQLFREAILYPEQDAQPVALNRRFRVNKGYIEASDSGIFKSYPFALLEIFLLLAQHPEIKGVRAATIRLIRDHRHLIDERFRSDIRARSLFMELLRQPRGIAHELRRMSRYGVLAAYVPEFGRVAGQMQYDLFHVYTVDQHSLFVVRNIRRFALPMHADELPWCTEIFQRLPKLELLYLGALFHDIAKGRGGDHSELDAQDALAFCLDHGLSEFDARLVSWLVKNHLLMSMTAQRRDISDPEVINDFASRVGDRLHLDYLCLLTVSDIRATNPSLWTSWKAVLLSELYHKTSRSMRRGLQAPTDHFERVRGTRHQALALLAPQGLGERQVATLWDGAGDEYFLRYSPDEIAWHARTLVEFDPTATPLIMIRPQAQRGGTEIFVYMPDHDHLFAATAAALEYLGLTVVDARIITNASGYAMDSYIVLEQAGEPITEPGRIAHIAEILRGRLAALDRPLAAVSRRVPRQLKHFEVPTRVSFATDEHNQRTVLEVIAADRPGLLSRFGQAFVECGIRLQNAKIATLGAHADDVFFITDDHNQPLRDLNRQARLRDCILKWVEEASA